MRNEEELMDNKRRWCTPADVMEDLSRASGRRLPAPLGASLLRGAHPPPPADNVGEAQPRAPAEPRATPSPDLQGITSMIRMVQDYGDEEWTENSTKRMSRSRNVPINDFNVISKLDSSRSKQLKTLESTDDVILNIQSSYCSSNPEVITSNSSNDIILSSKLNPNIEEFVPKSKASQIIDYHTRLVVSSGETDSKDEAGNATDINANESFTAPLQIEPQKTNHVKTIEINGFVEEKPDQCQIDRDELAAMLRKKINSASKEDDGVQFKRSKYVAIAHLLKLYSAPSPPPPAPARAVTLRTPRFYESCAAVGREAAVPRSEPDLEPDPSADATCSSAKLAVADNSHNTALTAEGSLDCGATDTPKAGAAAVASGSKHGEGAEARAVRDAIHKVTDWLNNEPRAPAPAPAPAPVPAPAPALYLGPISYKRRERAAPAAAPAPCAVPAPAPLPGAYVPTAQAAALSRQFAAQAQAAAAALRPLSIWDKIERDLKQKDEALRTRAQKRNEPRR